MLFDAAIYRQNKWHELVKNEVLEDVEIMRRIKTEKYNGELLLANGMASCRMYRSYREAINGFSKSTIAACSYNIIGFLAYLLTQVAGPMIVITTLNFQLILFMLGLIILTRIMISLSAGQNAWYNILLHPIQMVNLVIVGFLSIQRYLTKTLVWKGRRV
jgi:membrane-associated HD superfamily phosphohydrolase